MRRVIWTKDILAFAKPGEESLIDAIPLHEMRSVKAVGAGVWDDVQRSDRALKDDTSIEHSASSSW